MGGGREIVAAAVDCYFDGHVMPAPVQKQDSVNAHDENAVWEWVSLGVAGRDADLRIALHLEDAVSHLAVAHTDTGRAAGGVDDDTPIRSAGVRIDPDFATFEFERTGGGMRKALEGEADLSIGGVQFEYRVPLLASSAQCRTRIQRDDDEEHRRARDALQGCVSNGRPSNLFSRIWKK